MTPKMMWKTKKKGMTTASKKKEVKEGRTTTTTEAPAATAAATNLTIVPVNLLMLPQKGGKVVAVTIVNIVIARFLP